MFLITKIKDCFNKIRKTVFFFNKNQIQSKENYISFNSFEKVSIKPQIKGGCIKKKIIYQNRKKILQKLLNLFKTEFPQLPFIKIGVELEFYFYDFKSGKKYSKNFIEKKYKQIFNKIFDECKKKNIQLDSYSTEMGENQFEIQTIPYTDIDKLAKDIEQLKQIIKVLVKEKDVVVDFNTKPFYTDSSNSMQINLSFADEEENNLFRRIKDGYGGFIETQKLLYSVGGLCKTMNGLLLLIVNKEKDFSKYDKEANIILHKKGKIPAPTFVTWGIENRTAAIRISNSFKNLKDYNDENLDKKRRIEYRLPSPNSDIYMVLISVLTGIYHGLKNKINPPEKTSFNVFDFKEEEGHEKLVTNMQDAEKKFKELSQNLDLNFLFF